MIHLRTLSITNHYLDTLTRYPIRNKVEPTWTRRIYSTVGRTNNAQLVRVALNDLQVDQARISMNSVRNESQVHQSDCTKKVRMFPRYRSKQLLTLHFSY
jgi:hypothetical protein